MDKKVSNGHLSLILLTGALGNCEVTDTFDEDLMIQVVDEYTSC